ncbi:MAG TPA: N-formylglutamate amidohydrolase [Sphingomonas sp.]|uniref:N-formylglutamate amidohydrolase n=1 Tax=Sphingomonas sp. TaxID=28214 RepID=UPI002ED99FB5
MQTASYDILLSADDPAPVRLENPEGRSPLLLIGDHAGNAIPEKLGDLGVSAADRARHIGWDIGIAGLGAALSRRLDAVWISQAYSRLVIDCNRDPAPDADPNAIVSVSDGTPIPANHGLGDADRAARVTEIHAPYQNAIADEIARRTAAGLPTLLVALHSFTPTMAGIVRPWHVGILHDGGNDRLALTALALLRSDPVLTVGDNQPYAMDRIDHSIPRHAFIAGLPYVEFEVRQDLLADTAGIDRWCGILSRTLLAATREIG